MVTFDLGGSSSTPPGTSMISVFFGREFWDQSCCESCVHEKGKALMQVFVGYVLVGGLVGTSIFNFPISIGFRVSSQLTNSYFSEGWLKTTNPYCVDACAILHHQFGMVGKHSQRDVDPPYSMGDSHFVTPSTGPLRSWMKWRFPKIGPLQLDGLFQGKSHRSKWMMTCRVPP